MAGYTELTIADREYHNRASEYNERVWGLDGVDETNAYSTKLCAYVNILREIVDAKMVEGAKAKRIESFYEFANEYLFGKIVGIMFGSGYSNSYQPGLTANMRNYITEIDVADRKLY
ncbi:MAG: hypothetical protein FWG40_06510 [Peptococcaceae bacterium]|nr:hypothetical protein [Peptococcaceae bacterium]